MATRAAAGYRLDEDVGFAQPGFLAQQLELVVVDDDDGGARDAFAQLVARHARALLARVEDELDAERPAFLGILDHGARVVRRDARLAATTNRSKPDLSRARHRAGVH